MSRHDHENLRRIFDLAIETPAHLRAALLERECRGDAALRTRVEAMLAAAEDEQFLAAPTTDVLPPSSSDGATLDTPPRGAPTLPLPNTAHLMEGPGSRFGPYKLLQQIGEGGFGVVFLAEQEKPVARKVAIKIIKLGMDTRQVVARFEQERQALALMEHPNIARVLDAGATDTGRPYFVMELCKGDPVSVYCDKHSLGIEERLALFEQVCGAVQHAHTKGIIHRDIKPSNILVSTHDGRPHAKVIDFGIAKATASKLTEMTLFTEHRQLVGTPEYMSPEQAEGSLDIDTRTDVYSLGVLLYELLTGTTPFSGTDLRSAAYAEIQRIIREVEPPRPSTRLSQNTETLAGVAARRSTEPRRLGGVVRGELDWIVMKALEKDRQRRYETASGLALDIRRYLNGEAVVAAPPSAAYRLRKFVRRNRATVTAAAAVGAALLIGVVAFAWQARIAGRERDAAVAARQAEAEQRRAADEQRDRAVAAEVDAKTRAQELAQVAAFQGDMLSQIDAADAGVQLMSDMRARFADSLRKSGAADEVLVSRSESFKRDLSRVNATDAAAEMIDRTILRPAVGAVRAQFKDQPLVEASLQQTLADLYVVIGRLQDARPLQDQALATRRRALGDDHPITLESMEHMGFLLKEQGRLPEAEVALREALEKRRRVLGDRDPATLKAASMLGGLMQETGRLNEAEPLLRNALDAARATLGEEHVDTLTYMGEMGLLLEAQGRSAEAEPYLRETVEKLRRVKGEDDPLTFIALNNLGYVLQKLGRPSEAERFHREAIASNRRVRGEEHPQTLVAINNLAVLLEQAGRVTEAEQLYRELLDICRRVLGDDHPDTLRPMSNLANNLRAQGRLDEAAPLARESMDAYRRVFGDFHRDTLAAINIYGYMLIAQGKRAEAEVYWREAYEKGRKALGVDHPDVVVWTNNLGGLLRVQGKLDEAEPYAREGLASSRRVNGEEHPGTLYCIRGLALLLQAQGKLGEAETLFREALEKRRRVLAPDHPDTITSIADLADILALASKHSEAEPLAREALAATERTIAADAPPTALARLRLGRVLAALGRFTEAEKELLEAHRILSTAQGAPAPAVKKSVESLVALYEAWEAAEPGKGRAAEAARWKAQLAPPPDAPAPGA